MATRKSLPVRARRLANELKKRREAAGLTVEQAAAQLSWSYSKLNRYELARQIPSPLNVGMMLDLYGASSSERANLVQLAREANQRGWWADYDDVFTGSYVGLEDEAGLIRTWEPQLVPGLLQNEDYARAVIRAARPESDVAEIERRVQARMARKTLLGRPEAPQFDAIIGEAVLRQQISSAAEMHEQLRALLVASRRPNVSLRIVPFAAGAHAGLDGAFVQLEFPGSIDPAISYVEDIFGEKYIEDATGNNRIRLVFEHLTKVSLSVEESAGMIAGAIR